MVILWTAFVTRQMLLARRKDVLPAIYKSSLIYKYKCHSSSQYVRKTSQRLQDHIKQHVSKVHTTTHTLPVSANRLSVQAKTTYLECDSADRQL